MRRAAIFLTVLALVGLMMKVEAAPRGEKYKVTVTEFGTFQGLDIDNLKVEGSEQSLYSLVIDSLLDTKKFSAFEIDRATLDGMSVNYSGKITPDDAKAIGEVHDVRYIICGSARSIAPIESEFTVLSNGVKIYSVRARISLYMMDVTNGRYVKGAVGSGESSSSHVKVGSGLHTISIGTTKVAQSSVINALRKAAEDAVEKLATALDETKK